MVEKLEVLHHGSIQKIYQKMDHCDVHCASIGMKKQAMEIKKEPYCDSLLKYIHLLIPRLKMRMHFIEVCMYFAARIHCVPLPRMLMNL